MNEPRKHGFIYEAVKPQDLRFGSAWNLKSKGFKGVQLEPSGDWAKYLYDLIYTHQAPSFETNACVSHGTANCIELLMNRVHGLSDDRSDRFIAKGSNTDPLRGNTPGVVAQFVRDSGASSESEWPSLGTNSVDEYYAPLPQVAFNNARTWRDKFKFGYERVDPVISEMKEALKYSPLGISCNLWLDSEGEWYKPVGQRDGHWVTLLRIRDDGKFVILDSYPDSSGSYIKIAKPFAPEMVMRYALDYEKYNILYEITIGLMVKLIEALKKRVAELQDKPSNLFPPHPSEVPPIDLPMNRGKIKDWAKAIGEFESGKSKTSLAVRLNNPGAMKYTTYTASLGGKKGPAGSDGGFFCVFDTYEDGLIALEHFLIDACYNRLKSYKGNMTLDKFTSIYANVPLGHNYQKYVAGKLGVSLTTTISTLL